MDDDKTPQEIFDDFWKPFVTDQYGCFIPEAVKNELADYYFLIGQIPAVYDHVTGGRVTNPLFDAYVVTNYADEHVNDTIKFHMQDLYEFIRDCDSLEEALEIMKDQYEID